MNNKFFFLTLALGLFTTCLVAQTADPSAALEIDSTTKGFLPPRMTETQRDAINNPAEGLVIFNTSTDQLNIFEGTSWNKLSTTATRVGFSPTASLSATTTQAALVELANEKQPTLPNGGNIFCIWAEESQGLDNSSFEWSYGNGNETPNGVGIVLVFPCELIGLGLSIESTVACQVEVYRNNAATGKRVSTTNSNNTGFESFLSDPVQFNAGDRINFRTVTAGANNNGGVVVAWFRTTN